MSFFIPEQPTSPPQDVDPDVEWGWARFVAAGSDWITQTYVRLARAGFAVRLVHSAPDAGVVVVHARRLDDLLASCHSRNSLVVVSVRGGGLASTTRCRLGDRAESPISETFSYFVHPCVAAKRFDPT